MDISKLNSTELALYRTRLSIDRTRLANQRTYLAYMRTGFVIATIAGTFKKIWIALFGGLMVTGSVIQYYIFNKSLNNNTPPNTALIDATPYAYMLLSFGALYLQWRKKI